MSESDFNVYWWDRDDGQHTEVRFVDVRRAMYAAHRLVNGPAAILGIVKRVIITDDGGCCVFEWKLGEGIVWPTPDMLHPS